MKDITVLNFCKIKFIIQYSRFFVTNWDSLAVVRIRVIVFSFSVIFRLLWKCRLNFLVYLTSSAGCSHEPSGLCSRTQSQTIHLSKLHSCETPSVEALVILDVFSGKRLVIPSISLTRRRWARLVLPSKLRDDCDSSRAQHSDSMRVLTLAALVQCASSTWLFCSCSSFSSQCACYSTALSSSWRLEAFLPSLGMPLPTITGLLMTRLWSNVNVTSS